MGDARVSDDMSQMLLDKVGHQDLRSLLVLHQNIMRGGDLVPLKAVQQCNADYSRFEATDTAHSSKYGGLHFNIPHSGLVSFPQILQFFLMGEGAESSIKSALTFIEVMGAHGVSNHCGKVLKLRGALQKLAGHSLVQLSAPGDNFTQNHLLKLGAEGVVHCFIRDHHSPWSQTNSTRCSKAKQDHVTALSMVQQFDELMQHDGDRGDTHAMTYREHWSHFIHAVAISSLTDVSDFLWVSRQFQLLVDELGKSLHSIRTATNTHKLNISKHFWKVVSLGTQVEVVENILLHGVQVGIFHLHMLFDSKRWLLVVFGITKAQQLRHVDGSWFLVKHSSL